jgi:large subunit ribosomal protein L4
MPKKMRRLALRSALSYKVQESALTVVDAFQFDAPKTKEFKTALSNLKQPKKVLVVTDSEDVNVELSARNIPGVQVSTAQGLNVLDITSADSVVITESAAKKVEEVLG